uniref:Uncharacterized protein n=1 Tax=Glycine max TaxID=3847 RepID=A0A0R0ISA5_SOYBN
MGTACFQNPRQSGTSYSNKRLGTQDQSLNKSHGINHHVLYNNFGFFINR